MACHAITVANYNLTCSVVIYMIFNTCFGNITCCIGKFYFDDFLNGHFKLFVENCMKMTTMGQILFSNYELLRFSK
jgi:hypothetical protein